METEKITLRVTPEAARIYQSASEQERRKLDALLSLRLSEVALMTFYGRRNDTEWVRRASAAYQ